MQLVSLLETAYEQAIAYLAYVGGPGSGAENYILNGLQQVGNALITGLGSIGPSSIPGL